MTWYLWRRPFDPVLDDEGQNEDGWTYCETNHYLCPPTNSGDWQRVWSFGVGSVSGAGSSPSRGSVRYR